MFVGLKELRFARSRCPFAILVDEINQAVGRRIVSGHRLLSVQFRQDDLGQLFAELHAELIVRVDVPDLSLDEDLVLVGSNQQAQGERCNAWKYERIGRSVAAKGLVIVEEIITAAARCSHLFLGQASHQSFRLSKKIGE